MQKRIQHHIYEHAVFHIIHLTFSITIEDVKYEFPHHICVHIHYKSGKHINK